MEFYLPPQGVSSLLSMAHFCPGLHGPGCDHDCESLSFRAFFEAARSGRRQLVIPLFQRSYCWPRAMLEAWWRDATAGRGHRVGTVFTKDRDGARMVIDGQQRLTTAMLLVSALRDAALGLLRQGDTRRGRWSHSDAPLYILYGLSLMKYTGGRQNDCNIHG